MRKLKDGRRVTVKQAEDAYFAGIDLANETPARAAELKKPFGFLNAQWEALKTMIEPGDVLLTFCSDAASWNGLAGRMGYRLVRNGKTIAQIMTCMS